MNTPSPLSWTQSATKTTTNTTTSTVKAAIEEEPPTQTVTQEYASLGLLLQEAEEVVAAEGVPTVEETVQEEEVYDIVDLYPDVTLPQEVLDSLELDPRLDELQEEYNKHKAAMEAAQLSWERKYMELQNEAKANLLAEQQAKDEAEVSQALDKPEMIRLLATVLRLAKAGRAGELINTLEQLEGTKTPPAITTATVVGQLEPEPIVTPINTQPAPAPTSTGSGWGAWG